MEHSQEHGSEPGHKRSRPQPGRSLTHQPVTGTAERYLSYSNPLPQRPWDVPFSQLAESQRGKLSPPSISSSHAEQLSEPQRTIPEPLVGKFRDIFGRRQGEEEASVWNPFLLYPPMSPYDDIRTVADGSRPIDHTRRATSQPVSPRPRSQDPLEPSFAMFPRSPTYPPASRRRIRSTSNLTDATFTDDEEFHLFAQATTGLGPEHAFRPSATSSSPSSCRHDDTQQRAETPVSQPSNPDHLVSPIEETPTTRHALLHMAQLPQGFDNNNPAHQVPSLEIPLQTPVAQRLSAAMSGLEDFWPRQPPPPPPSRTVFFDEDYNENDGDDLHDNDDEELPNYAQSQAQAQVEQRMEAARRARELERRWEMSR